MKQLLCIMLMCFLFSCTSESEQLKSSDLLIKKQQEKINHAEEEIKAFLEVMESDSERKKQFIREVKQKPGDREWKLECFRKHYAEMKTLMNNFKEANHELQRLTRESSHSENKID